MKLELFISWRYLVTKRKEKFISLISLISVLGVAIGVMALIVVIGVMAGFDRELREKIVGNYAHITLTSFKGLTYSDYNTIAKQISANKHVVSTSPYIQGQALIKEGDKFFGVGFKAIQPDKEATVGKIKDYVIHGSLKDLSGETVIVGKELANYLGLRIGTQLSIYSPLGKQHSLKVVGIFNSGMYDYDLNLIFVPLKAGQDILGWDDQIGAIAIKLDNLYQAERVRKELYGILGFDYNLKTWTEANQNFFAALKLEKLTMFIILTLIILVASFNIISTLMVMVVEKTKDIGILKSIGVNSVSIRKIFTLIGIIIGGLGTIAGVLGGIILCVLLEKYQFIKLPQDIYYINKIPVYLAVCPDLILIILSAMAITLVSTIYPAAKAAQLKPVEALRYE